MIILESQVDRATHAVNTTLKQSAVSLEPEQLCALNDLISNFLTDNCNVQIKEHVTFDELSATQRGVWLEKVKDAPADEKALRASYLFDRNSGLLPMSEELKKIIDELSVTASVSLVFDTGGDENLHIFSSLSMEDIFKQVVGSDDLSVQIGDENESILPYIDSLSHEDAVQLCDNTYDSTRVALEHLCEKCSIL